MPVEIKELVIRTVIGKGDAEAHEEETDSSLAAASLSDSSSTEEIVQECVRQVMRIVARNEER
jgi:hypothetical protein